MYITGEDIVIRTYLRNERLQKMNIVERRSLVNDPISIELQGETGQFGKLTLRFSEKQNDIEIFRVYIKDRHNVLDAVADAIFNWNRYLVDHIFLSSNKMMSIEKYTSGFL